MSVTPEGGSTDPDSRDLKCGGDEIIQDFKGANKIKRIVIPKESLLLSIQLFPTTWKILSG